LVERSRGPFKLPISLPARTVNDWGSLEAWALLSHSFRLGLSAGCFMGSHELSLESDQVTKVLVPVSQERVSGDCYRRDAKRICHLERFG
jgi:hypothetical protein